MQRSRLAYAIATIATIVLGLASRRYAAHLPWWLAKNAGDALYATMMFFGLRCLAPRARVVTVATIALAICFAVEFSQLYRAPWIDAVRATTPGRLILGQGFHALDLACYAAGVALAVALEAGVHRRHRAPGQ